MIKEILKNEIKDLIGHAPSDAEFKSALDYLSDNREVCATLAEVEICLRDWRDDKMQQCEACGEYFLELQEFTHNYRVMGHLFCSGDCCENWDEYAYPEKPERYL